MAANGPSPRWRPHCRAQEVVKPSTGQRPVLCPQAPGLPSSASAVLRAITLPHPRWCPWSWHHARLPLAWPVLWGQLAPQSWKKHTAVASTGLPHPAPPLTGQAGASRWSYPKALTPGGPWGKTGTPCCTHLPLRPRRPGLRRGCRPVVYAHSDSEHAGPLRMSTSAWPDPGEAAGGQRSRMATASRQLYHPGLPWTGATGTWYPLSPTPAPTIP